LFVALAPACGGCGFLNPMAPPDFALPMQEIVVHAACELQFALRSLDAPEYARFNARNWLVTVTINPKTDADVAPGIGFNRTVPSQNNPIRFSSWVIGAAPGIQLEVRGDNTSSTDFTFKSGDLINDNTLQCDVASQSYHVLAQHLGIGEWLHRSVDAMYLTGSASIDKPSYNTEIYVRFGGNGSYTYTFPGATDLASLMGYYQVDEQLNINFSVLPETQHFTVVTLPKGGAGFTRNGAPILVRSTAVVEQARLHTDLNQIQQAIRSLQTTTTR